MATACKVMGEMSGNGLPRSDLVGLPDLPAQTTLSGTGHTSLPLTSPRPPPAVPARSHLRPPARSISSQSSSGTSSRSSRALLETPPLSGLDDSTVIVDSSNVKDDVRMDQEDPIPLIDELLQAVNAVSLEEPIFPKTAPGRPDSPITSSLEARSRGPRKSDESSASSEPTQAASHRSMSKREHALHELLSSERAYASDLALIREVHIPLATGQTVPLQNLPLSPPNSSASSSRTLSTASDSSTASLGPPMTQEDAKVIFSNISELAMFSDMFCEELEAALGSLVPGGTGHDRVGHLFLRIIDDMARPYQHYITRHPTALQHLQNLPSTPALQNYLAYTQSVASSLSHAWDLASLLIKPVQRLLKYPLLLSAIIDETPDSHPDKQNLRDARAKMEEVARNVNEIRRRAEVVKDVLTSKKKSLNVAVTASVNLGKLRPATLKNTPKDESPEAQTVEKSSNEMKAIEEFAQKFAKIVVESTRSMFKVTSALRTWAIGFGKVIGLSDEDAENQSEAFNAFLAVIEDQLLPLCRELESIVNDNLLRQIAYLLKTMNQPSKLITSMYEQQPLHYHLLNMNVSKNRPPPALLAASTNYLALRGQLAAELPTYVELLHTGMELCVIKLADIQMRFWRDVRDKWAELWDMLRVEGELNGGHDETINVWRARWADVDEVVASLSINQAKKLYQEPERARPSSNNLHSMLSSLEPGHSQRKLSYSSNKPASLDPSDSSSFSSSFVSVPRPSHPMPQRSLSRRGSSESFTRKDRGKSPRRKSDRDVYAHSQHPYPYDHVGGMEPPAIPRRKSMPLSSGGLTRNPTRRATSPPRVFAVYDDEHGPQIYHPYSAPVEAFNHRDSRDERPRLIRDNGSKKTSKNDRSDATVKQKSATGRQRSSSVTSFFKSDKHARDAPPLPTDRLDANHISQGRRNSWVGKPTKYITRVIHPCMPPRNISYFGFPFFDLYDDEFYEVLQEAGHPSIHPKLPMYVDEGEDCLLLCKNTSGEVGWALASFMEPVDIPR